MSTTVTPSKVHQLYCSVSNGAVSGGSFNSYNVNPSENLNIQTTAYNHNAIRRYRVMFFEFSYTLQTGKRLSKAVIHLWPSSSSSTNPSRDIQAIKYADIDFNNFTPTIWYNQYRGRQEVSGNIINIPAGALSGQFYDLDITSVVANQPANKCVFAIWCDADAMASSSAEFMFTPIITSTQSSARNANITLDFADVIPQAPSLVSPSGEIIEKGLTTFSWIYNSQHDTGQTGFDFEYKASTSSTWTTVHVDSAESSYSIDTSSWNNGQIDWRVRTYNSSGNAGPYASTSFELIGAPAAPTINSISNDAIPVLNWSADMSEAATIQMIISRNNVDIWDSGELAITNSRDIKADTILSNGTYSARIRIGSIYGQYSQWTGRSFTISASVPSTPSISVAIRDENAVITTTAEGIKILYRNNIPIAVFTRTEYVDTTLQPNRNYTYFIRLYEGSYADSASRTVRVQFSGWKLSLVGSESAIRLDRNTSEPYTKITRNFDNEVSYNQYIGRGYPVKEAGNGKSESFTGAFYLTADEFENLVRIINENGTYLLRGDTQVMYCNAEIGGATNSHLNRGYAVTVECTRIYHDEVVHFSDI